MNQIVKSLKEQSAQAGTANQWKLEQLCKMAALEIETKAAANDRQALMIYAKDRQIAELTRMLFALGKQDGQTIRTQAAEIAELKGISANLAKHLEAIQNIAEREDGHNIDPYIARTIYKHCEAANVMEAV